MVMLFYGKKEDTLDIYSQQPDHEFSSHISLVSNVTISAGVILSYRMIIGLWRENRLSR